MYLCSGPTSQAVTSRPVRRCAITCPPSLPWGQATTASSSCSSSNRAPSTSARMLGQHRGNSSAHVLGSAAAAYGIHVPVTAVEEQLLSVCRTLQGCFGFVCPLQSQSQHCRVLLLQNRLLESGLSCPEMCSELETLGDFLLVTSFPPLAYALG